MYFKKNPRSATKRYKQKENHAIKIIRSTLINLPIGRRAINIIPQSKIIATFLIFCLFPLRADSRDCTPMFHNPFLYPCFLSRAVFCSCCGFQGILLWLSVILMDLCRLHRIWLIRCTKDLETFSFISMSSKLTFAFLINGISEEKSQKCFSGLIWLLISVK